MPNSLPDRRQPLLPIAAHIRLLRHQPNLLLLAVVLPLPVVRLGRRELVRIPHETVEDDGRDEEVSEQGVDEEHYGRLLPDKVALEERVEVDRGRVFAVFEHIYRQLGVRSLRLIWHE